MYNVAVIGDKDSVAGFGTLGLDTYFTDTRDECRKIFKQLASSGKFAVIYITEKASEYVTLLIAHRLYGYSVYGSSSCPCGHNRKAAY